MTVLVDTTVWSLAFRRQPPLHDDPVEQELSVLVREGRAELIGPVRQELLSGLRNREQFLALQDRLREFVDLALDAEDFERAAEFYILCRSRGVQGSSTDLLICAAADRRHMHVFTTDVDFRLFARHIPIRFHRPRSGPGA